MNKITRSRLKELITYNSETGEFIHTRGNHAGKVAGSTHPRSGHRYIKLDGTLYAAHRLAWLYMTGAWPASDVDHINMAPADNRWENLREATRSQNRANTRARGDNASGVKGISWDRASSRWRAQIQVGGKKMMLGRHQTKEAAREAYAKAAKIHFGEFARTA